MSRLVSELLAKTLPPGIASRNRLFQRYKFRAKKCNIPWQITLEQFEKITKSPCYLCGVPPRQKTAEHAERYNGAWVYNGIDRVDNTRGYVVGNVKACCALCNRIKSDLNLRQLRSHLKKMFKMTIEGRN